MIELGKQNWKDWKKFVLIIANKTAELVFTMCTFQSKYGRKISHFIFCKKLNKKKYSKNVDNVNETPYVKLAYKPT